MSTIAAISTPEALGGIAVIRISGENAFDIAEKIFIPFGEKKISEMNGYTCSYGYVHDNGERIDDCILTIFRAPHSYTGENIAEISCHGGIYVTKRILRLALKNGAENAEAGEFTKRAFLNNKLDLTSAEAVMDIISANGENELKMAENLRRGATYKKVKKCSDSLVGILGGLAAWADYPDEDIPEVSNDNLFKVMKDVKSELSSLIENYDCGRIIREGISTVIVGKPNVGKSTLFNCLSGYDRSIVTDIAGTTRDAVEETVRLGDIKLRLIDTAGIRDTDDIIEGMGVEIAERMIESAQLVIVVFDGSKSLDENDLSVVNKINYKKSVAIINKSDIDSKIEIKKIENLFEHIIYMSAKNRSGIDNLKLEIEKIFSINEMSLSSVTAANERQKNCIEKAIYSLNQGILALENGEFLDAINVLIDEAEQHLLELTGEKVTEAVVDEVFSKFCVGK